MCGALAYAYRNSDGNSDGNPNAYVNPNAYGYSNSESDSNTAGTSYTSDASDSLALSLAARFFRGLAKQFASPHNVYSLYNRSVLCRKIPSGTGMIRLRSLEYVGSVTARIHRVTDQRTTDRPSHRSHEG